MATKKEILKNPNQFSPEEIADAIRSGIVSLYELGKETEGAFTPLLKKKVKEILAMEPLEKSMGKINENKQIGVDGSSETKKEETVVEDAQIPEQGSIMPVVDDPITILPVVTNEIESAYEEQPQSNVSVTKENPTKPKPSMFSNPFSFEGRIRRLEYGLSIIIMYAYSFLCGFIAGVSTGDPVTTRGLMYLFLIPGYWFCFAQGAKRCHDRNNSGWYQIIPFYGLWMLFGDGDADENKHGVSPK